MKNSAIIVAGGLGHRMALPKADEGEGGGGPGDGQSLGQIKEDALPALGRRAAARGNSKGSA